MSRDLMYEDMYKAHGGLIPVKWTAPEVKRKINVMAVYLMLFICLHSTYIGFVLQGVLDGHRCLELWNSFV